MTATLPEGFGPWAIVANLIAVPRSGPDGGEHRGTRIFAPGAKVHVATIAGGALAALHVVGLNRVSKRLSACIVATDALENARCKVIHGPKVLARLRDTPHPHATGDTNVGAGRWCLLPDRDAREAARRTIFERG